MATCCNFSCKPLWKLLIDKDLTKSQLQEAAGLNPATMAKLGNGNNVATDSLARICKTLHGGISDIREIVPADQKDRIK